MAEINLFNMKYVFVIFMILGICGCSGYSWKYYYPYCDVNPATFYKSMPIDFEDCLNQFDSILSINVINYFKNQDSAIAYIEISQEIGGLFINYWNLRFFTAKNQNQHSYKPYHRPLVIDSFINQGITDSEAMVRVLFSCYHKRLNNIEYNWDTEIKRIKSYWIPAKYGEGWVSPQIKQLENEILIDYHFKQLAINDSVDILYNRAPRWTKKSPDWYYLTGIIQYKKPETKQINVELIDIKSEFGHNFMLSENDTITIGDTLTDYCKGWLKRGIYYFNYHRNTEYRTGIN